MSVDDVKVEKGKVWTVDKQTEVSNFRIADDGRRHVVKVVF